MVSNHCFVSYIFFFNDPATTEFYTYGHTLSLHDALPICGKRADAARTMARRWAKLVPPLAAKGTLGAEHGHETGLCLALAFPDRVSKRRPADGADWASVGGRGFRLDPLSPLAREDWLAVGDRKSPRLNSSH